MSIKFSIFLPTGFAMEYMGFPTRRPPMGG